MAYKKMHAVLEIYHDSDLGPMNVDFEHTITLFKNLEGAREFIGKRQSEIMQSGLAKTNECVQRDEDLIVFASDDFYKWEIKEVEVPE